MATEASYRAVLLDGMGTLVRLVPPVPALAAGLGVDEALADRAFRAEVAYYVEHQLDGSDPEALEDLRDRCARVVADVSGTDFTRAREALMQAIRFEPFEDAAPALLELRAAGLRLVVVSNWDCSLPEVLRGCGLLELVDAVVTSAAVGASKPDPRVFRAGLGAARAGAADALHVGDSPGNDVDGARAAGIRALLLDRGGGGDITSLAELAALVS